MSLGPRACALCGPGVRHGCVSCGMKDRHQHVAVLHRDGSVIRSAALCADCAPRVTVRVGSRALPLSRALVEPQEVGE